MPANNSSGIVHYWAGRYPGKIGWLIGPSAIDKTSLRPWLPYALDNDAFTAFRKGTEWDESAWVRLLQKCNDSELRPLWALVPDVVANAEATLEKWNKYSSVVERFGFRKAFAVQDGMMPKDVPHDADVVFVGGTTEWKWSTVGMWARIFRRVHIGRVNTLEKLLLCERLGCESIDGTGWFRATSNGRQGTDLGRWVESTPSPPATSESSLPRPAQAHPQSVS